MGSIEQVAEHRRRGGAWVVALSVVALLLLIPQWWAWTTPVNRVTSGVFVSPWIAWPCAAIAAISLFLGWSTVRGKPHPKLSGWTAFLAFWATYDLFFGDFGPSDVPTVGGTFVSPTRLWPMYAMAVVMVLLLIGDTAMVYAGRVLAPHPTSRTMGLPSKAPTEKLCPDCAETIKAAARVCRFCGHRFDQS